MLTLKRLKQYESLCRESKLWRRALDRRWKGARVVSDTVVGSSEHHPYTAHPITITGGTVDKLRKEEIRYQKRVEHCEACKQEIEDYIDSVEDSQLRQILYHRYIKGRSWLQVAQAIGGGNSEDAVKKRVYRHFDDL